MSEPEQITDEIHDIAQRIHNRIVFIKQVRGTVELLDSRQARRGVPIPDDMLQDLKLDTLDNISDSLLDEINALCTYVHLLYCLTENEDENNGSEDSQQDPPA